MIDAKEKIKNKHDPLDGNIFILFFRYVIPTTLGLAAVSSATAIDAIFLGHYVGPVGLATISMVTPIGAFIFGAGTMLIVGGSITCGRFLGEKNYLKAQQIFTTTLIALITISVSLSSLMYFNLDDIVNFLGVNEELFYAVSIYTKYMLIFTPFLLISYGLCVFARTDNNPILPSISLLVGAFFNVFFDWYLITQKGMGVAGAAIATGLSYSLMSPIILLHFFSKKSILRAVKKNLFSPDFIHSVKNGVSEFLNEISVGVMFLVFNWILVERIGTIGVAALGVIDAILLLTLLVVRGVCESMEPLVSKNDGALNIKRIKGVFVLAFTFIFLVLAFITGIIAFNPELFVNIFMKKSDIAFSFTLNALIVFFPAFLFSGLNVLIASFFTSLSNPNISMLITLSRSLLLPIPFLFLYYFLNIDNEKIFLSIVMAEVITFFISLKYLFGSDTTKFVFLRKSYKTNSI